MSLYLGLNQQLGDISTKYLNYPVIKIVPRDLDDLKIRDAFLNMSKATHFVFTSQSTVSIFFKALKNFGLPLSSLDGSDAKVSTTWLRQELSAVA